MRKFFIIILCIITVALSGCTSNKEIYIAKQVLIDINNECVLKNINDETLETYSHVDNCLTCIGDKIIVNDNKVIFNGSETKGIEAKIIPDDNNIQFSELPTFLIKGAKKYPEEIHIYISVNQTLSYLIYEKK